MRNSSVTCGDFAKAAIWRLQPLMRMPASIVRQQCVAPGFAFSGTSAWSNQLEIMSIHTVTAFSSPVAV